MGTILKVQAIYQMDAIILVVCFITTRLSSSPRCHLGNVTVTLSWAKYRRRDFLDTFRAHGREAR